MSFPYSSLHQKRVNSGNVVVVSRRARVVISFCFQQTVGVILACLMEIADEEKLRLLYDYSVMFCSRLVREERQIDEDISIVFFSLCSSTYWTRMNSR